MRGMFITLGGKYAVGTLYDKIVFKGYTAYLIKPKFKSEVQFFDLKNYTDFYLF